MRVNKLVDTTSLNMGIQARSRMSSQLVELLSEPNVAPKRSITFKHNLGNRKLTFIEAWLEYIKPKEVKKPEPMTRRIRISGGYELTELTFDHAANEVEWKEKCIKKKIQATRAKNRKARKGKKK